MFFSVAYQSKKNPDLYYEVWFKDFKDSLNFCLGCSKLGRKAKTKAVFIEGKAA